MREKSGPFLEIALGAAVVCLGVFALSSGLPTWSAQASTTACRLDSDCPPGYQCKIKAAPTKYCVDDNDPTCSGTYCD